MEIGSFIELQFNKGLEWHREGKYANMQVARLNTGRAAIFHALRVLDCKKIYLPLYQCDTVRDFLVKKGIEIEYYSIDKNLNPIIDENKVADDAILIVNYYGIIGKKRLESVAKRFRNVIIDNSQAFFTVPLKNCINVYSARKFVGVPDGAYAIGNDVLKGYDNYLQSYSSRTANFLLSRHEFGCEGDVYQERMLNEKRIDNEDVMKMSPLTRKILDGTDYKNIIKKRRANFNYARKLFDDINLLDIDKIYRGGVPMVYPLVVEDDRLLDKLLQAKHFQGHWWSYLLDEVPKNSVEYWLSRYVIPITIDQRYGRAELDFIREIIR